MKIAIIAPFSFGYIDSLARKLAENISNEVIFVNTADIEFEYKSLTERGKNFLLKSFLNRNIKAEHAENEIEVLIQAKRYYDHILVVRPDKFSEKHLHYLKNQSKILSAYLFDSISSIPEQIENIELFDRVFSYDKVDVENNEFHFVTNFIAEDTTLNKSGSGLFNISSFDERFDTILEVATQLKKLKYPYKIVIKTDKKVDSNFIETTPDYWSLEKSGQHIKESEILLDIQKENQNGLSFRVFEALGFDKKLITTNKSIKEYDFYRPENILIINKKRPVISEEFLKQKQTKIPESVKSKYRREAWIEKVFY